MLKQVEIHSELSHCSSKIHRGDNDGQQLDPGNSGVETLINATPKNENMNKS